MGAEVTVLDSVFDADPVGDFLTMTGACTLRTLRTYMDHPRWEEVDPCCATCSRGASPPRPCKLLQAIDRFHLMNLRLVELFHTARILVTPTCSGVAPFAGEMTSTVNGETTVNWIQFTYPFNMTRSPAATVRVGTEQRRASPSASNWSGPSTATWSCCAPPPPSRPRLDLDTLAPLPPDQT